MRGYRNALLTSQNYSNLTQCENIDGMPATSRVVRRLTVNSRCQATAIASLWRLPLRVASQPLDVRSRR